MFESFRRTPSGTPKQLSPDAFVAQRTDEDVVIDVRKPDEYAGGHVAGAENVDVTARDFREQIGRYDRDKTYYLYCRSGNRSGRAA